MEKWDGGAERRGRKLGRRVEGVVQDGVLVREDSGALDGRADQTDREKLGESDQDSAVPDR